LGPKGFYSGRDKSDLEGMTQTLMMIGASEGAIRCGRKGKVIFKSDRESYGYFAYRCLYL
jgi:hypothetical protein